MKSIYFFLIFACISLSAQSQHTKRLILPYDSTHKTVAITVNPIFGYLGNMFNQQNYNDLNLTSLGIIYRKFQSESVATRVRGNFGLNRTVNDLYAGPTYPPTEFLRTDVGLTLGVGKEYRKQLERWSMYGGAEFILQHRSSASSFVYSMPIDVSPFPSRELSSQSHRTLAGAGLFLGAEYFLSNVLFVGAELSAPLLVGMTYGRTQNIEELVVNTNGQSVPRTRDIDMPARVIAEMGTGSVVAFRAGLRF